MSIGSKKECLLATGIQVRKLVWQQGSLETVRRYIDTKSSHAHTSTADDINKLLEQAQNRRVLLISDSAGMDKSTY